MQTLMTSSMNRVTYTMITLALGFILSGKLLAKDAAYWSKLVSEESVSPSECNLGGAAIGLSCSGSNCDNLSLLCDVNYRIGFPRVWSAAFSNKDADGAICDEGSLVTGVSCDGSYCSDLKIKCSAVKDYKPTKCEWSSVKTSDGAWKSEKRFWFPEGYALAGLRCENDHCDDLYAYLCTDNADSFSPVDELPRPYYTGQTGGNQSPALCNNAGAAIALGAEYGFSGSLELVCDTRIKTTGSLVRLEGTFSEELGEGKVDRQVCPDNMLMAGIDCNGSSKCDDLTLSCVAVENFQQSQSECKWSDVKMSDKQKGMYQYFYYDEQWAIAGLRCEGSYCDDMYAFICKKPN